MNALERVLLAVLLVLLLPFALVLLVGLGSGGGD